MSDREQDKGYRAKCFDPECHDTPADVLAVDTTFGVRVAFCSSHEKKWLGKDHIKRPSEVE